MIKHYFFDHFNTSSDGIRKVLGRFFVNPIGKGILDHKDDKSSISQKVSFEQVSSEMSENVMLETVRVTISDPRGSDINTGDVRTLIGAIQGTPIYTDINFAIEAPTERSEASPDEDTVYSVEPNYNYFISGYEESIKSQDESSLLNIYSFISDLSISDKLTDTDFLNDLNDPKVKVKSKILNSKAVTIDGKLVNKKINNKDSMGAFLTKRQSLLPEVVDFQKTLTKNYANTFITSDSADMFNQVNEMASMFPMNIRIDISPSLIDSAILDLVQSKNYAVQFLTNLVSKLESSMTNSVAIVVDEKSEDSKAIKLFEYKNAFEDLNGLGDSMFVINLGQQKETNSPLISRILSTITLSKINEIAWNNTRSLTDILNGQLAKKDLLGIKIVKRNGSGKILSTIIFPNLTDAFTYVDTQVKYNTDYIYSVSYVVLTFGTKYQYTNYDTVSRTDTEWKIDLKLNYAPYIMAIEVPVFTVDKVRVMDSPPCPPDVNVITYIGEANKVAFNLSGLSGDYEDSYVQILGSDKQEIDRMTKNGFTRFKSESDSSGYEMFMLEKEPTKYQDFANGKHTKIKEDSVLVDIESNKTYWFMFRALDLHNHFSNPSEMFQIKLVNNAGQIYPIVDNYVFPEQSKGKPVKFRKTLQVIPSLKQQFPIDTTESVLNKRFLLRIRSVKTGKVLELDYRIDTSE